MVSSATYASSSVWSAGSSSGSSLLEGSSLAVSWSTMISSAYSSSMAASAIFSSIYWIQSFVISTEQAFGTGCTSMKYEPIAKTSKWIIKTNKKTVKHDFFYLGTTSTYGFVSLYEGSDCVFTQNFLILGLI